MIKKKDSRISDYFPKTCFTKLEYETEQEFNYRKILMTSLNYFAGNKDYSKTKRCKCRRKWNGSTVTPQGFEYFALCTVCLHKTFMIMDSDYVELKRNHSRFLSEYHLSLFTKQQQDKSEGKVKVFESECDIKSVKQEKDHEKLLESLKQEKDKDKFLEFEENDFSKPLYGLSNIKKEEDLSEYKKAFLREDDINTRTHENEKAYECSLEGELLENKEMKDKEFKERKAKFINTLLRNSQYAAKIDALQNKREQNINIALPKLEDTTNEALEKN